MEKKFGSNYTLDDLIAYLGNYGGSVEQDNEGQLCIYTGLFEHSDGSLYDEPES